MGIYERLASEFDDYEFYIYDQWAHGNLTPIPDPLPGEPHRKILRGGDYAGFGDPEEYLSTFMRFPSGNIEGDGGTGFRIVYDVTN